MVRPDLVRSLTLLASLLLAGTAYPLGLKVSPGGALIQGVTPGERVELATPLTILNDDDQPHAITLTALKPSKVGMRPPTGYADIPDPAWLSFSESTVTVPARGHAAVKMALSVPGKSEHYPQHWSVALAVRTKPEAGQMLTIGLYPCFEIETVPAPIESSFWKRGTPPYGDLVVTPSVETVGKLKPGDKPRRVPLRVWNNTDKPWRGEASVLTAEQAKTARIDLSGGWTWLPDPAWAKPSSAAMTINGHRSTTLEVDVAVPDGKERYGGAWEGIVLLKSLDGPVAFARLRLASIPLDAATQSSGK